jgi:hypothetical protein
MKTSPLTLSLLLASTPVDAAKINMMSWLNEESDANALAQATMSFRPSCDFNIKRIKNGPDNWTKIIGTGSKYSDPLFPADNSMIVWSGYARSDFGSLGSYLSKITGYRRPTETTSNPSLWGGDISTDDIDQGSVGDCYMMSVASSLAEYP